MNIKDILKTLKSIFALDKNVVHLSGNETIDGIKTLTATKLDENNEPYNYSSVTLRDPRFTKGDIPSKTEYIGHIVMLANNQENPTTTSERIGGIVVSVDNKGGSHVTYQCLQNKANDTGRWLRIEQVNPYNIEEDPYTSCSTNFIPRDNNSYGLGTSTNKWKTINGVEPSSLCLATKTYTNISISRNTNVTMPHNGLLRLSIATTVADHSWMDFIINGNIMRNRLNISPNTVFECIYVKKGDIFKLNTSHAINSVSAVLFKLEGNI